MKQFCLLFVMVVLVSGCAAPQINLTPGAQSVKVGKSDPLDNYEEVGPVSGYDGQGCGAFGYLGTYERAVTDIKNKAYKMGGNYVQIFTITEPHFRPGCFDNFYKISGTAYKQIRELPSPTPIVEQSEQRDVVQKLRELKTLREEGIISESEFQEKKAKVLQEAY